MLSAAAAPCTARACKATPSAPRARRAAVMRCEASRPDGAAAASWQEWSGRVARGAAAFLGSVLVAQGAYAGSFTYDELQALSYLEVKGSGLANQCSTLGEDANDGIAGLKPGSYKLDNFCMEPSAFKVKPVGNKDFEPSTLLTRNTYTLDQMTGTLSIGRDGTVSLQEKDGIDFAPVTVKLRGGVMVPFLYTVKGLEATGPADGFAGNFTVASYRGATFMDPQGRGAASGWDYTKGLQAAGNQDAYAAENAKSAAATTGEAVFAISKVDPLTNEVAGVFVTRQLADDDLGSKDPADIQVEGVWYARLS